MAAFIKSSARFKSGRRAFTPVAEINVTPMVDVMLVLLVIFIVTAPLLTTGVNVNLPQTKRTKSLPQDNKALTLYVQKDGSLVLNDAAVDSESLQARLAAVRDSNADVRIYVKGDKDVPYGVMMQVMASVTAAGITQVAFVTEPQRQSLRTPR